MLNEQQIKKTKSLPQYREIASKLNTIIMDIENLDCLSDKDYFIIETKINQIKNKILKSI